MFIRDRLYATIRSVLAQTERDLELILIDDGSTDNSLAIMLSIAAEDERIKLISQSNKGVSTARNLGLAQARGALVAFMDSDDLWTADELAIHRALHERKTEFTASYAKIDFLSHDALNGSVAKTFSTVKAGT